MTIEVILNSQQILKPATLSEVATDKAGRAKDTRLNPLFLVAQHHIGARLSQLSPVAMTHGEDIRHLDSGRKRPCGKRNFGHTRLDKKCKPPYLHKPRRRKKMGKMKK